jgi:exodeoxyribonuclease VII small subunit
MSDATPTPPSFEEALAQLEKLVDAMESGESPLETLLNRYEEGVRLLRQCEARLRQAEARIALLQKEEKGPTLTPFRTEGGGE